MGQFLAVCGKLLRAKPTSSISAAVTMVWIGQSAGNLFQEGSSEATRLVSISCEEFVELTPEWVVGFVDGEGCFHVSVNRHREMTAGFQVLP